MVVYICLVVMCARVEDDVVDLVYWTNTSEGTGKFFENPEYSLINLI